MTKLDYLKLKQQNIRTEIQRLTEIEHQYGATDFTKKELASELFQLERVSKTIASEEAQNE